MSVSLGDWILNMCHHPWIFYVVYWDQTQVLMLVQSLNYLRRLPSALVTVIKRSGKPGLYISNNAWGC